MNRSLWDLFFDVSSQRTVHFSLREKCKWQAKPLLDGCVCSLALDLQVWRKLNRGLNGHSSLHDTSMGLRIVYLPMTVDNISES